MISENIEALITRSEQKGIQLINNVSDNINIYADEKMINSVLVNLLSNAVKFTKRNGEIIVQASETENQMIEISVKDSGTGIREDEINKLFNAYDF